MFYLALPFVSAALAALPLGPSPSTAALQAIPTATAAAPDEPTEDVLIASDGQRAEPGRVPNVTPEATAKLWQAVVAALPQRSAEATGPAAFELALSVRHKDDTGSRDFKARFGYLDARGGLVRMQLLDDDGRTVSVQMRGPDPEREGVLAYWFRKDRGEGTTDGWIERKGGDARSEQQEVDRWAAASFDIARLLDPNSMRIVALRALERAPDYDAARGWLRLGGDRGIQLPPVNLEGKVGGRGKKLAQLAGELDWIELATPDFRLFETGLRRAEREALRRAVKRVVFGVDRETRRPQLIIVSPLRDGALQVPGSLLLQCTQWFPQDEDRTTFLPGRFYAYETVESEISPTGLAFSGVSTADLFLLDGSDLAPKLTVEDFKPGE